VRGPPHAPARGDQLHGLLLGHAEPQHRALRHLKRGELQTLAQSETQG